MRSADPGEGPGTAEKVFAKARPEEEARRRLVELFLTSITDVVDVTAAERMAKVWVEHVGRKADFDEKDLDLLDRGLGLGTSWMTALADPASSGHDTADLRRVLIQDRYGYVNVHPVRENGEYGKKFHTFDGTVNPHKTPGLGPVLGADPASRGPPPRGWGTGAARRAGRAPARTRPPRTVGATSSR